MVVLASTKKLMNGRNAKMILQCTQLYVTVPPYDPHKTLELDNACKLIWKSGLATVYVAVPTNIPECREVIVQVESCGWRQIKENMGGAILEQQSSVP